MNKIFEELFKSHTGKLSDKWNLYLQQWDDIFLYYKDKEVNILEIGIQNGGSLEIWAKYFRNAQKIVGCDINQACRNLEFDDDRIKIVVGDANSNAVENKITNLTPNFDIIIDDGSHKSDDIIISFSRYYNKLNVDGIYVIEDLHASYWKNYNGGLHNPYSAISFLKRLIDIINYQHWRNNKSRCEYLSHISKKFGLDFDDIDLSTIGSIQFLNSICIIKKQLPEKNRLGRRVVVGFEENITENYNKYDGTSIFDVAAVIEDDSNLDVIYLIEQLREKQIELNKKNNEIEKLKNQIKTLEREVLTYALSKSWRYTRPFRKFSKFIKGK